MRHGNFIIFGSHAWKSTNYGIQRITKELSADNRILYINPWKSDLSAKEKKIFG